MNYHINTEIQELSKRIKIIAEKSNSYVNHIDEDLIEKETKWNMTRLFSEIIYHAENKKKFTKEDLDKFHLNYEKNIKVNLNNIINKQWIRIINKQVRIASSIISNFSYFRKNKNDKIKPDFIKENINEFEFLFKLHQKIGYRDENKLIIKKHKLKDIINKHKIVYDKCPTLDTFKKNGYIQEIPGTDIFEINEIECKQFCNEIAGLLWERLLMNKKVADNYERLQIWADKIFNISYFLPNLSDFTIKQSMSILIETTIDKVLNEPDLLNSEKEIDKLWWDNYMLRNFHNSILTVPTKFKINTDNHFSLYNSLKRIDNAYDIVHYQKIRMDYSFLINLIINNDKTWGDYQVAYPYTKKLLKKSLNKPFVFWEVIKIIEKEHPEIIPYLLPEDQYSPIAQILLSQININTEILNNQERNEISGEKEEIITEIWLKGINILIDNIEHSRNYENISTIFSQIFIHLLIILYREPNNNQYYQEIVIKEILTERYKQSIERLKNIKEQGHRQNKVFPNFIGTFYNKLKEENNELPLNAYRSMSFYIYDILLNIVKILNEYISADEFNENERNSFALLKNDVVKFTFEYFIEEFTPNEIIFQSDYAEKPIKVLPKWILEQYGFEKIIWETFIVELYQIEKLQDLNKVLNSIILKIESNTENNEWNNSQTYKIRILLRILLISYIQLINKKTYYEHKNIEIASILYELEMIITKILLKHNKTDIAENKIDIFSNFIESSWLNQNKKLFPICIEAINFFKPKNIEKIINSFAESKEFVNLYFTLYNQLTSERDKKYLQTEIERINIDDFLKKQYYIPNIEAVLIEAVNSNVFIQQAKTLFKFYDEILISRPQIKNHSLFFRIQLLIAYRDNDENQLNKIVIPKKQNSRFAGKKENLNNYKKFYGGLFKLRNQQFQKAFLIFKNLHKVESNNFEFWLRKLYTKTELAEIESQNDFDKGIVIFQEIYDELDILIKEHEKLVDKQPHIYLNKDLFYLIKLIICSKLEKYEEFDGVFYNSLNTSQRLKSEYLELAIERLIKKDNFQKASELVTNAESYHRLRNNNIPDFIIELKKKLNDPSNIANSRAKFEHILALSPKDLIKTIPARINPFTKSIGEFLLWEICYASNQFLTKIKSVKKNIKEDEFTDLLQIIINGQLKVFFLKLEEQNRTGIAESKDGIGSADLTLPIGINNITIEALRAYSYKDDNFNTKRIIEHIEKTFNYSTSKNFLYNIVYYQKNNFNDGWQNFITDTLPKIKFPNKFDFQSKKEITKDFGNDTIKIIQSNHDNDLIFYHIFLNLNYTV